MVTSTLEDGNEAKLVMGIDDEPTILQFLRAIVGQAGYKFADASSGEKALALARQAKPDLVFLDVTMDGIDGYQTCRRLRAEIPDFTAPVIFLTARRSKEAVQKAIDAGGNDFMIKPFQPRAVLERLARWLPEE
ncbi:MAG TPA: response regulator [Alphaproteobacteria bacterium]|jgi:DNA-binding response OmpR family regulator|nr:response regulator [Alphaproteobacteria bacterium]MDP7164532.1 response regulator [Alphaproteobacteria bacterium]HJM48416.1 response regulator [Alphaproteobacteria bacterium]|tara:strand:+ start:111 stop:512 length:402 start_codon:yes stop_codon:yes gene_type:complete